LKKVSWGEKGVYRELLQKKINEAQKKVQNATLNHSETQTLLMGAVFFQRPAASAAWGEKEREGGDHRNRAAKPPERSNRWGRI